MTVPSAYVVAGVPLIGLPASRNAGVSSDLAAHDAGQQRLLLLVGARLGHDQGAAAERLPDREVLRPGAGLAQQYADLGQPQPLAAVRLRDREPEQPGLGELGPAAVAVEDVGQHGADRSERLGALGAHLRESVGRHVQNCNVF